MTYSRKSETVAPPRRGAGFDEDEFRRTIERAKKSGLIRIREEGVASPIEKTGIAAATAGAVRSLWMDVTPEKAADWLKNNFRNRKLSAAAIVAYARDMLAGAWVATHQGVAFNDRDELIDGQHRLHAIVRSGVTVRMMVTFGLPATIPGREMTTMDAVDRGATRTVGDQLLVQHGIKHGGHVAAICASLANLCCGERTRRLSVGHSLAVYRAFQESVDWIIEHRPRGHGVRSVGNLAAFAFAARVDEFRDPVRTMFLNLASAEAPNKRPTGLLKTFLLSDEAKLLNRGTDRGLAELVLQAINLELVGRSVRKLEPSPDGVARFRELQAERVATIAALFRLPEEVGK